MVTRTSITHDTLIFTTRRESRAIALTALSPRVRAHTLSPSPLAGGTSSFVDVELAETLPAGFQ